MELMSFQNVKILNFSDLVWEGKQDSGHGMWTKEFPMENVAPNIGFLATFGNIIAGKAFCFAC